MLKKALLTSAALLSAIPAALAVSGAASADDGIDNILPLSGFYVDARYRFEHVEEDNLTEDADASTLRTKIGYKTNSYQGFQGLIEFENVAQLGPGDYNDTVNGQVAYPIVADPSGMELNQIWLSYAGLPDTVLKAGRQGVNLDNQRFIGTVGWRQNDQTFDAVNITNTSLENLELFYDYTWKVNRIFGTDHPLGTFESDNHIVHAAYTYADWLKASAYGYWMDFNEAAVLSNKTWGLRLTGTVPLNDELSFFYEAEGAMQHDHGQNPNNYDSTYYHLSPGLTWNGLTLQAGFESLEGDGTTSFQTPLATLHAHNGWADRFLNLNALANGLEDAYGKASYTFKGVNPWLDSTKVTGVYHRFDAERGGVDYGREWNLELARPLKLDNQGWSEGASISLKYANYDADSFSVDTRKWWAVFQVKF